MIVLEPGFKGVSQQWPQFVNMSKSQVEDLLKKEMPGIEIKNFDEEEFKFMCEEFYFGAIALVTNKQGVVVCAPKFFGQEPDFEKISDPLGKDYQSVSGSISSHVPSVTIIVKDEEGKEIWRNKEGGCPAHVLVTCAKDGKVCKPLKYMRSAK